MQGLPIWAVQYMMLVYAAAEIASGAYCHWTRLVNASDFSPSDRASIFQAPSAPREVWASGLELGTLHEPMMTLMALAAVR